MLANLAIICHVYCIMMTWKLISIINIFSFDFKFLNFTKDNTIYFHIWNFIVGVTCTIAFYFVQLQQPFLHKWNHFYVQYNHWKTWKRCYESSMWKWNFKVNSFFLVQTCQIIGKCLPQHYQKNYHQISKIWNIYLN